MAIVRLLAARTACACGGLVAELPLFQSTVSQHLKELKAAGLVQDEASGKRTGLLPDPRPLDPGPATVRQRIGSASCRRDYSAAGRAAAGVRNAWISSTVARAERPTPINVAEANPVQLP